MDLILNKFIFLWICLFICSCQSVVNYNNRNVIEFKQFEETEKHISQINLIIKNNNLSNFVYVIFKNKLSISLYDTSVVDLGNLDSLNADKLYFLETFHDKVLFLNALVSLNNNNINWCRVNNNEILYIYRSNIYMADSQYDLERFIVYADRINEIDTVNYKVLDHESKLYLLANKNAKIWADD